MVEENYSACDCCGLLIDDGNFKDDKLLCHDCLDNEGDKYAV